MEFSVNIEFYTRNADRPEFIIEPKWWKIEELLSIYPFVPEVYHGFHQYYYVISKQQLKELDEMQLKNLPDRTDFFNAIISQLENVLTSETDYKKIRILIFEWDLGN